MADEYLGHQLIWLLLHAIDHDIRPYAPETQLRSLTILTTALWSKYLLANLLYKSQGGEN